MRLPQHSINKYEFLEHLRTNRLVSLAQFNHFVNSRNIPNDPQLSSQWQYINNGQSGGTVDADLDAELAWTYTTGGLTTDGDTIVICIIEEGLDPSHEDLSANLWINHQEIPNNEIDDDNNGYVDDYQGWNVVTQNDNLTAGNNAGWHGTPVAGIAGARGNNDLGVTGVNWQVKVMTVVRGITEAQTIAAYSYPYTQRKKYNESNGETGAFVVATNTSWGVDFGQPEDAPMWCAFYDSLGMVGILDAAATINGNFNVDLVGDLPTSCPSDFLIGVTNINHFNQKNVNAGYGTEHIDLGAYGTNVWTLKKNNSYGSFSGTSAAAPHVSGAIGLLYSAPCPDISWLAKNEPEATALLIKSYLMDGVTSNDQLDGLVKAGGQLNLFGSLQLLMDNCAFTACFPPSLITAQNITDASVEIDWLAIGNINSEDLSYRELGAGIWLEIDNVSAAYTLSNLQACTTYEYRLRSTCDNGQSDFSVTQQFKTDGCCEAPGPLEIGNLTTESFTIEWPEQTAAQNYFFRYRYGGYDWIEFNTAVATVSIDGLTPCTEYEVQVSTQCIGGTNTDYSDTLQVQTMGCSACLEIDYCEVGSQSIPLTWISRVVLNDLDHESDNSETGYSDFTTESATLLQGYFHNLSIETDFDFVEIPLYLQVWIDFNQDGIFADSDLSYQTLTIVNSIEGSINIPPNALLGNTRMRVIASEELLPPCDSIGTAGEIEDYCVNIVAADDCLPPSGYSLQPGLDNITLSWMGSLITDNYNVRYRKTSSSDWIHISTSLHYLTIEDLSFCSDYELQVQAECDGENSVYSPSQYFTTLGCGVCLDMDYCEPIPGSIPFEWIAHFQLNDLDHYSEGEGYGDFTGVTTNLLQGEQYDFIIEPGFAGDSYEEYYCIWIDYNQDGTFTDLSEKVYDSGAPTSSGTINGQFTVPNFSVQGATRLRVTMKYFTAPDNACEGGFDGEIQDYCINIYNSPGQACPLPNGLEAQLVTNNSAYIVWNGPPAAVAYQFRYKPYASSMLDWQTFTGTDPYFQINGLEECALYEYQVRSICDTGLSAYTDSELFETECAPVSTQSIGNNNQALVFPNPFDESFTLYIKSHTNAVIRLSIFDATGKLTRRSNGRLDAEGKLKIVLDQEPTGVYFLKIQLEDELKFLKVVKSGE